MRITNRPCFQTDECGEINFVLCDKLEEIVDVNVVCLWDFGNLSVVSDEDFEVSRL